MSAKQEKAEALRAELSRVLAAHGASLFFGEHPAALWIDGANVGTLRDDESGDGSALELKINAWERNA